MLHLDSNISTCILAAIALRTDFQQQSSLLVAVVVVVVVVAMVGSDKQLNGEDFERSNKTMQRDVTMMADSLMISQIHHLRRRWRSAPVWRWRWRSCSEEKIAYHDNEGLPIGRRRQDSTPAAQGVQR
jgi:hypothetical protein